MKINNKHFYEMNFQDFVHIKYLRHVLKDVVTIVADNIGKHKTIDSLDFKTDENGEQELHVIYTDLDGQQQDQLMKPAITKRVNEIIDQRFRWIQSGDDPIKKLEIKDHYFKVTTDKVVADFIVPYLYNEQKEQQELHIDSNTTDYVIIKLVAKDSGQQMIFEVPTKKNIDDLKQDYNDFKKAVNEFEKETNDRLDKDEQTLVDHEKRISEAEKKNTEQDERLTTAENNDILQNNSINAINEWQSGVDSQLGVLLDKSHNFLTLLDNPADFNGITENGNYFVYNVNSSTSLTGQNRPTDSWGILCNYRKDETNNNNNTGIQLYISGTENGIYTRTETVNGWTEWTKITTPGDLSATLTEFMKQLVHVYFDGKLTDVALSDSPAHSMMILNDDDNLFKGLAVFDNDNKLIKRIILDNYATQDQIEDISDILDTLANKTDLQLFKDAVNNYQKNNDIEIANIKKKIRPLVDPIIITSNMSQEEMIKAFNNLVPNEHFYVMSDVIEKHLDIIHDGWVNNFPQKAVAVSFILRQITPDGSEIPINTGISVNQLTIIQHAASLQDQINSANVTIVNNGSELIFTLLTANNFTINQSDTVKRSLINTGSGATLYLNKEVVGDMTLLLISDNPSLPKNDENVRRLVGKVTLDEKLNTEKNPIISMGYLKGMTGNDLILMPAGDTDNTNDVIVLERKEIDYDNHSISYILHNTVKGSGKYITYL